MVDQRSAKNGRLIKAQLIVPQIEPRAPHTARKAGETALAARTLVPLGSALPAGLARQFQRARNVAPSVL